MPTLQMLLENNSVLPGYRFVELDRTNDKEVLLFIST